MRQMQVRWQGGGSMSLTPQESARLITAVAQARDRAAFAALFEHFAPRIKTLLMRSGSTPSAAEELAQEAMLMVWRKAELFDAERASAAAWIFTIARNLKISSHRGGSTALHAFDPSFGAQDPPQPDSILSGLEDARLVRAAMSALTPDQARAIEMAFFHEQTHTEISQALGVPLGTIKARIRFGMLKLRAIIERETRGPE